MREHLKRFHNLSAKHHARLAKCHAEACSKSLDAHADLGKDHPLRAFVRGMADFHEKAAGLHSEHADMHFQMCKSLGDPAHNIGELADVEELSERGEGGGEADNLKAMYKLLSST
jgi:hypothetical protein